MDIKIRKTPDEVVTERIVDQITKAALLSETKLKEFKKHLEAGTLDTATAESLFEFDRKKGASK